MRRMNHNTHAMLFKFYGSQWFHTGRSSKDSDFFGCTTYLNIR